MSVVAVRWSSFPPFSEKKLSCFLLWPSGASRGAYFPPFRLRCSSFSFTSNFRQRNPLPAERRGRALTQLRLPFFDCPHAPAKHPHGFFFFWLTMFTSSRRLGLSFTHIIAGTPRVFLAPTWRVFSSRLTSFFFPSRTPACKCFDFFRFPRPGHICSAPRPPSRNAEGLGVFPRLFLSQGERNFFTMRIESDGKKS